MSNSLATTTCSIHPERPAVARCPSCRGFFCSECITEHSGKLICASCLAVSSAKRKTEKPAGFTFHPFTLVQLIGGILICWALFYFAARFLADMPDEFHDGTIWE